MKRVVHAALFMTLGYLIGTVEPASARRNETLYSKLEVLAEVLGEIESNYVDMLSPKNLIYGAAKGAAAQLDEHSQFFTPEEYVALRSTTDGEYAGIGVEMARNDGLTKITKVYEDSPAAQAGLRQGDVLLSVDGKPIVDTPLSETTKRLRGRVGTKVVIQIQKESRRAPWDFTLVRGWIRVAPIATEDLGEGIRYARVKTFSSRVTIDLEAELKRAPPKTGLVLDLRGNPGGLFDEAVGMCDLFIDSGNVVTVMGRAGRQIEKENAHPERTMKDFPIAVLIDGGSASAAEIVAGCLKDRGRARLFGSKSYGKGSVQSIVDLSDGSGLKLTIARYLTPSGEKIDGRGIHPDEAFPAGDLFAPLHAAVVWLGKQ
ncbi:MAG: S41 family peptidase [Myxococcota bacterium]